MQYWVSVFYTSYNTEGSTTRTLTSPSTPASNAQMAFAFVANAARTCDADVRAAPAPAPRRAGPCRGRHVAKRNAPATAQPAVVAMPPPIMPANGDGDRLGDRKGLEGTGKEMPTRDCLRPCPLRSGVRPSQSVRSSQHTLQFRPVRTRQRAAHGMCTGLDSLMALAQCPQECASCPLRNTLATLRHRRRHPRIPCLHRHPRLRHRYRHPLHRHRHSRHRLT